ncbi:hypothetical protein JK165_08750 [Acetobacter okinawensis]|uniref:hypothetical protein n=1 Tax=Acetobacter okinawensis TaxID=1076594 RepID=UPI001BA6B7DA|nr:hypothetical protein [Acetobacter okinawensis]MBS0966173.1 hypothetical protein [Acetobacter okinawensis]
MINEIRAQALAHAMELAKRAEELEASNIVKNASVFEAYLCGIIPCLASIDDAAGSIEPPLDLGACNAPIPNWNRGQILPLREGEFLGNNKDQPLTGCGVTDCAHRNSSPVQDGESVGKLPTPSRTETVAAPGDTEEAARTHGGAA